MEAEAATWALVWHAFGTGRRHEEAKAAADAAAGGRGDTLAQRVRAAARDPRVDDGDVFCCNRVVAWLEELAGGGHGDLTAVASLPARFGATEVRAFGDATP